MRALEAAENVPRLCNELSSVHAGMYSMWLKSRQRQNSRRVGERPARECLALKLLRNLLQRRLACRQAPGVVAHRLRHL